MIYRAKREHLNESKFPIPLTKEVYTSNRENLSESVLTIYVRFGILLDVGVLGVRGVAKKLYLLKMKKEI